MDVLESNSFFLSAEVGGEVFAIVEVDSEFHPRFDCVKKTYEYRFWNAPVKNPKERLYSTYVQKPLDIDRMNEGAKAFIGTHDFAAFCTNKRMKKSTVRRIDSIQICREGPEVRITVTGNGFLHNMVRIITGTLIEVGRGERSADSIPELFGGKRAEAGFLAPAQGLCLMEVFY